MDSLRSATAHHQNWFAADPSTQEAPRMTKAHSTLRQARSPIYHRWIGLAGFQPGRFNLAALSGDRVA